jgi:diaminopimelate decarboxylase
MVHNTISKTSQKERALSLFSGRYICETDTLLIIIEEHPEIKEGDILSFRNAGAVCYSISL